ncbi:hypothetical protein J2752_002815 [Halarchaeum rubridurum]|uniref:Uncharacterized protein n=1 Tax=Halarchaeum rubridurum TaxID=489911 RepID=A0A830G4C1_9EURY|nr:hypothetical protein [Halarchaeum rubridurum]MBP1955884.1 hypothetical protein [Halarchaeum rubridurum]GGM75107.1 hypothetical protein GCM10009017_26300 [Halarchaeum rubridurum]
MERSVLERFRAHDAVQRGEMHGSWVVRYDGRVYWADLHYGQFVEETYVSGPDRRNPIDTTPYRPE